jgi:membrane-bound lytic murein transglycosylase D
MSNQQPIIHISYEDQHGKQQSEQFRISFRIGRGPECDVCIPDPVVSRKHVEVVFLAESWWVIDDGSANGTFVDGVIIDRLALVDDAQVELGKGGPVLSLHVEYPREEEEKKEDPFTVTQYQKHYFDDKNDDEAGEHTMMVRQAFNRVQKKQKKKYGRIIAAIAFLFVIAGSVAVYKHFQVIKQKELAGEIFYNMKAMELEFADLLASARESKDAETIEKVQNFEKKAKKLEESYTQFVDRLEIYEKNISEEKKLILKMARTFGECEIFMPDDFAGEVLRYINKWKSTKRFSNSVGKALRMGYSEAITTTMLSHDLPPQFFYLALQESNFNINACGPKTRWGIAKGMWQFIPSTAKYYGLKTGPLAEYRKPDPNDERHNFLKSTKAAAKYLRHIYDTDAQASGLLVMASYNWGENRVNRLINEMPENPRERNFWQFLKKYKDKMPKETYDYVFYIFSAAVIGENPELFGFDMDNPLAFVES